MYLAPGVIFLGVGRGHSTVNESPTLSDQQYLLLQKLLVVPVRRPFLNMFSFFLKLYKVPPPLSISILYITLHLYKVFKFIYKMCIYIFFVSLLELLVFCLGVCLCVVCFCFGFDFGFLFCCMTPRCRQWTSIAALKDQQH